MIERHLDPATQDIASDALFGRALAQLLALHRVGHLGNAPLLLSTLTPAHAACDGQVCDIFFFFFLFFFL